MPKVTAPLLSFGASGQIAKSQVYSTWKGVPYVRRYAIPANPRTTKQVNNRSIWAMINGAWLYAPAAIRNAFNGFAVGKPLTGRNKFFQDNQKLLATDPPPADITGFVMSPGSGGGLPPSNLIVAHTANTLTLSATIPAAPDGWSITKVWGGAILNQDPTDDFSGKWTVASDDTAPYSVALTGLTNAVEYAVGLWIEWVRPDGKTAYSISISDVGTPGA
jgi:hypothetical protein